MLHNNWLTSQTDGSPDYGELIWAKSRYSNSSGDCVETTMWRKSRRSNPNGACVETRWAISPACFDRDSCVETNLDPTGGYVLVRDTKDPDRTVVLWLPALSYYRHYQRMLETDGNGAYLVDAADPYTWDRLAPWITANGDGYDFRDPEDSTSPVHYFTAAEIWAHILGLQDPDYTENRRLPIDVEDLLADQLPAGILATGVDLVGQPAPA